MTSPRSVFAVAAAICFAVLVTVSPGHADEPTPKAKSPHSVFDGQVLRKGDRTPVAAAIILVDGGALEDTTDGDGRFAFPEIAPGSHKVRVRGPGIDSYDVTEVINAGTRRSSTYYVIAKVRYQSTVRGARPVRETVEQTLDVSEITRIPGTQGDALKAVQNLPGVARSAFGLGQLVVWGSAPEDTRVYVDGSSIPTLFHFGGLRSTVNSEVVQNLTFTPGGYGADNGFGLGGLVEIETRAPRTDGFHGFVQLDIIDGSLNVEGPITKKLSFGVTARRSWIDVFLPLFTTNNFQLSPTYWDYQLRLHYTPTSADTFDLIGIGSDDTLDLVLKNPNPALSAQFHTHTYYHKLIGRWVHRFSDGGMLTVTPSAGVDIPFELNAQFGKTSISVDAVEIPYDLRAVYRRPIAKNVRLDAGIDFQGSRFDLSVSAPISGSLRGGILTGTGTIYVNGLAPWAGLLFTDDKKKFTLNAQLRADVYILAGDYSFPGYVDPTQQNASFLSTYLRPEARISTRYQFTPWFALKAAVGLYHQAPDVGSLWGPLGDPKLEPEQAIHAVVGADFNPTSTLSISVEGFYKELSNLIVSAEEPGQAALSNEGIGRVYGGELLVRQQLWKNFFGWVSYTLSRAERRDHPDDAWALFQYDQTHILTVIGSYTFPRGYQVGLRFRYVTGNPYTPVIGAYSDLNGGGYTSLSGPPYSGRLDSFNQLDVRFDKAWTFNKWKFGVYLDIQNVYNAKNPEAYQYNFDYSKPPQAVAGIPFFPALGVRGDY